LLLHQSKIKTWLRVSSLLCIMSVAALLCFSACGSMPPQVNQKLVQPTVSNDLVSPGFLTVGSYTTYPPQENIDPHTGNAVGFDIDLISAVASRMNLKIKIVSADYRDIINDLLARNFDVVISAISITSDLQEKVAFVPYFNGGESLLVAKGNPRGIKKLMDLCGQKVAVQDETLEQKDLGMLSSTCQQAKKLPLQLIVVQDQGTMLQLLTAKKVVATYQDSPLTDSFIKQYPQRFEVGGAVVNANLEGIAIRKNDTRMFKSVQAAFNTLTTNGTYCSLINKWGLTSGVLMQDNRRIC
jgi:polar amino acid transport system substrate-binding protein